MRFGGLAVLAVVSGCFGPGISSGQFQCAAGLCPEGFRCEAGRCVEGADQNDGFDAAAAADPDAAAVDAAEVSIDAAIPPAACYGEVPIDVVSGQVYSGDTSDTDFDSADGCPAGPLARGNEHYYVLVLGNDEVPATVEFDLDSSFDSVLRLRQGICDDEVAEFLCQDTGDGENHSQTISAAGDYYTTAAATT